MPRRKRASLEERLASVRTAAADAHVVSDPTALLAFLDDRDGHVVAKAVEALRRLRVPGVLDVASRTLIRLLDAPYKADRGCAAKTELLHLLDDHNHADPALLARCARFVQMEPSWGPAVDAAAPLRARALLAISRMPWLNDRMLFLAEGLCDPLEVVQRAAVDGIVDCRDNAAAALLLMKVLPGGDLGMRADALGGLIRVSPEQGVRIASQWLDSEGEKCNIAAYALAVSRDAGALVALIRWHGSCILQSQRDDALCMVAAHRSQAALDYVRSVLVSATAGEASASVTRLMTDGCTESVDAMLRGVAESHSRELWQVYARLAER